MDTAAPRVDLGSRPTPLEAAPRLARALGLGADDLWLEGDVRPGERTVSLNSGGLFGSASVAGAEELLERP